MDQMVQIATKRWNEAKGSIGPFIRTDIGPGPFTDISVKDQVWIIWYIDMTWTIRLRYRKPSSIESDIGGGPIDPDIGSKIKWAGEWSPWFQNKLVLRGTDHVRNHPISEVLPGSFIRFLRDGPIPIPYSNWTDIEPIVNRYGKQSAPECRRAFCCHIPERIPAIKNNQEQTR